MAEIAEDFVVEFASLFAFKPEGGSTLVVESVTHSQDRAATVGVPGQV